MAKSTKKVSKVRKAPRIARPADFASKDLLQAIVKQAELHAQALEALSLQLLALSTKINLHLDKSPAKLLTEPTNPASNLME